MKKGTNRIIFGSVLLVLQLMSIIGSADANNSIIQNSSFLSGLAFYIGYLLPGICGALLLVFGIKAYRKGETLTLILHNRTKILNCIFGFLLLLLLILGVISDIDSMLNLTGILYAYSTISMIIYLWFHQGKKPSPLYAVSVIATGSVFVITPLVNLTDLYSLLISAKEAGIEHMIYISLLLSFACGVTNIASGILIYRETFSVPLIKALAVLSFVLFMIPEIETIFDGRIYIDFYSVRYLLQLAILVYTCFIPIHTNEK